MENEKKQATSTGETVTFSRAEYEAQKERIAKLERQVELLTEAIRLSRQNRFGTSSEHTSEEELVCPVCGDTMTEIGKDVRRRLKLVPAKVVVVEDWYYTYACQKCSKEDVLHADETTLQVLHEPGKTAQSKSYMWLYRTSGDTDRPIVLYEYQPGRGACHPKTFLAGFRGYLHTDGYAGYHNLPEEITVVGCWAHAR